MEVHAHTHPASGGTRKKWTHYLWEFLMLFLAVFCGFLAENKREHMVEHQREKQYINSLLNNLQDDTGSISFNQKMYDRKVEFLDSLLSIRYLDFSVFINRELFYYYCKRSIYSNSYFINNDATLVQLRNSGALRLIKARGAADSINTYQSLIEQTMAQREAMDRYWVKTSTLMEKIIDQTIFFDTVYFKDGWFTGKSNLPVNMDKQLLLEFFNAVQSYKLIAFYYNNHYLKKDKEYIEILDNFLRKKYHIKK
jgi:hypothetical protein